MLPVGEDYPNPSFGHHACYRGTLSSFFAPEVFSASLLGTLAQEDIPEDAFEFGHGP